MIWSSPLTPGRPKAAGLMLAARRRYLVPRENVSDMIRTRDALELVPSAPVRRVAGFDQLASRRSSKLFQR